jgi:BirA family biotin operon repressor/biotin-[acetyl-CoA-carboxylase] ligase
VVISNYHTLKLDEIDSTNEEARRFSEAGETQATWIVADVQTAGRGRRGRSWVAPRGNLMTTLYWPFPVTVKSAALLSFVASLAVRDVVADCLPQAQVDLKWPNDVLVNGQKIAGILLEAFRVSGQSVQTLAVGIGINITHHPDDTPYPATHIGAVGQAPTRDEVFEKIKASFAAYHAAFDRSGFAPIRKVWLEYARGRGSQIEVRLANETLSGLFEDLDGEGQLCLRLPSGELRLVTAGDVYFPEVLDGG